MKIKINEKAKQKTEAETIPIDLYTLTTVTDKNKLSNTGQNKTLKQRKVNTLLYHSVWSFGLTITQNIKLNDKAK